MIESNKLFSKCLHSFLNEMILYVHIIIKKEITENLIY